MKLNNEYAKKHSVSPSIVSWDDDGIMLCKKIKKLDYGKRAEFPYLKRKTGIEKVF